MEHWIPSDYLNGLNQAIEIVRFCYLEIVRAIQVTFIVRFRTKPGSSEHWDRAQHLGYGSATTNVMKDVRPMAAPQPIHCPLHNYPNWRCLTASDTAR